MSKNNNAKSCLIISYGPVPTPEHQTVEGGGMRAWGLAQGLKDNGIDVTVAVNAGFPQNIEEYNGVSLTNWNLDAAFVQLINSFDAVIASYCMGDPSVFIADNVSDDVQLILDCYVPIYIEVSARESKHIEEEYVNYAADIARHNHVLKRGDYFLYANRAQEQLYKGVLSALGIINPKSYRDNRLLQTPFGIHRQEAVAGTNPYDNLGISSSDFVVLWFGGIYPWFRIQEYLATIHELSSEKNIKFVFVGGKNPFNPNPDFSRQYDSAVNFCDKHNLTGTKVFFVDWVDFDTRVNWFRHADVIVSLNQPGEENKYSWRTRVMDFVWGEAVIVTNGGDPLSDELIDKNAAIRINGLSSESLIIAIRQAQDNPHLLSTMKDSVKDIKNNYYWDTVTQGLSEVIQQASLPFANEAPLRNQVEGSTTSESMRPAPGTSRVARLVKMPVAVLRKVRQKGVLRSLRIARDIAKNQIKNHRPNRQNERQYIFISHPINNTGAPIVLLQIIEEYVHRYGANKVRVVAPGIEPDQKAFLKKLGVSVEHAVFGASFRFIRLQLGLRPDDFVLMNTIAIYDSYRDFVLLWLKNGRLRNAHWFIHEDQAQIPIIHAGFLDKPNIKRIAKLCDENKLSLYFPSRRTADEYSKLLGVKGVEVITLRVDVDEQLKIRKKPSDFDEIGFYISGTAGDGRKGQLIAIAAFQHFLDTAYRQSPDLYRNFKLHLVAVGHDDYVSQQIRWIGQSTLGERVKFYESMPKDDALEIASRCNVVMCCSLNETFGLYIAEAMQMGHVVMRNTSAGVDEQLVEGKNGLLIDHTNVTDLSEKIAKILNKKQTTNKKLAEMSLASQKLMEPYANASYLDRLSENK